jgi:hypothetical protein
MTVASHTTTDLTAGRWQIPRTRGAVGGLLLMLCGIWAALIPFVGPYFDFAYTPNVTWHWSWARFWMDVLPGIGAFVGGFLLLMSRNRATAMFGGWLAAVSGLWLIVGPTLSMLWHHGPGYMGVPFGGNSRMAWEQLSFFYGIGALTLFLATMSLGRLSVHSVRDVRHAERRAERDMATETTAAPAAPAAAPARTTAPASEPARTEVPQHEHTGMTGTGDRPMGETRVNQPVYPEEPGATNVPVEERMRTEQR